MSANPGVDDGAWTPAVTLNLDTSSATAFADTTRQFAEWSAKQPPLPHLGLSSGWHNVTPQMSEEFLRRTKHNRKPSFAAIRKYANAMKAGNWHRTGQTLVFNVAGEAEDLQHR